MSPVVPGFDVPKTPAEPAKVALKTTDLRDEKTDTRRTFVTALVAPPSGAITNIDGTKVEAGTPVVTVAQSFWQNPTIKWARGVMTAVGTVLTVLMTTFLTVWTSGHSIFQKGAVNWRATEVTCEIAAGTILATAILAFIKKHDNNPIA